MNQIEFVRVLDDDDESHDHNAFLTFNHPQKFFKCEKVFSMWIREEQHNKRKKNAWYIKWIYDKSECGFKRFHFGFR